MQVTFRYHRTGAGFISMAVEVKRDRGDDPSPYLLFPMETAPSKIGVGRVGTPGLQNNLTAVFARDDLARTASENVLTAIKGEVAAFRANVPPPDMVARNI